MLGLSAKVFRTCYSSASVETKLLDASVKVGDPEYLKKYVATLANLEAAKICNHRRTIPKTWRSSLEKKKTRLKALRSRAKEAQEKLKQKITDRKEKHKERLSKAGEQLRTMKGRLEISQRQLADKEKQGQRLKALRKRVEAQCARVARQRQRLRKLKSSYRAQMQRLRERLTKRRHRDKGAVEKLRLQIETKKETRDYNLGTSLKSYIDPRIYYKWGRAVDYDWKRYYPKALRKKFSWVETKTPLEAS
jgi:DNA topoisomerase-1